MSSNGAATKEETAAAAGLAVAKRIDYLRALERIEAVRVPQLWHTINVFDFLSTDDMHNMKLTFLPVLDSSGSALHYRLTSQGDLAMQKRIRRIIWIKLFLCMRRHFDSVLSAYDWTFIKQFFENCTWVDKTDITMSATGQLMRVPTLFNSLLASYDRKRYGQYQNTVNEEKMAAASSNTIVWLFLACSVLTIVLWLRLILPDFKSSARAASLMSLQDHTRHIVV